ncbi:MAG: hypothetical protein KBF21_13670 [Thermoanaerobaculia bacterium]|nr:hypothetical protein [Thermoanaerobaculia bacterium]MBP9825267.1 hypothetical protein [Thermoanaerobaculia bacterium]
MDEDLDGLSREALVAEVVRLRAGIRRHRESSGHALCWYQPELWGLLPETSDPLPEVPDWEPFLHGCVRYRASLDAQLPHAPRVPAKYEPGRPSDPQPQDFDFEETK